MGGPYRCIEMDPPWPERGGGRIKRGADRHYPVVPMRDMWRVIVSSPLWNPNPNGCHVWIWATSNFLAHGIGLFERLGARYITHAVWVKTQGGRFGERAHDGGEPARWFVEPQRRLGLGQYLRHEHEHLLLGRIGMLPRPEDKPRSVVYAPATEHSVKPAAAYAMIERVSPGPRASLFARAPRVGWDVWGNEVPA